VAARWCAPVPRRMGQKPDLAVDGVAETLRTTYAALLVSLTLRRAWAALSGPLLAAGLSLLMPSGPPMRGDESAGPANRGSAKALAFSLAVDTGCINAVVSFLADGLEVRTVARCNRSSDGTVASPLVG
jgi:hypothetical protein